MENETRDLQNVAKTGSVNAVLKAILNESPEIMTGLLGRVVGEVGSAPIRVLHATLKGNFLKQLAVELEKLRRDGVVKEDYLDTNQGKACFIELLSIIDHNSPDPSRLDAIRKVFLAIATEKLSDRDDPLPQQILSIVGELSSGELILLAAIYQAWSIDSDHSLEKWISTMLEKTRFKRRELVLMHEKTLTAKLLIHPRQVGNPHGVVYGDRNRLTSLGVAVCDFLNRNG